MNQIYVVITLSLIGGMALPLTSHAQVVLNEILGSTTGPDSEFIELFNNGDAPVDIGGWSIVLYESDNNTTFGETDGGSPFFIDAGVVLEPGQFYLLANDLAVSAFSISPDQSLDGTVENSSYTAVLLDLNGIPIDGVFVTDGGVEDMPNIAGVVITPDLTVGPDGTFLPAGFSRQPDGGTGTLLLDFNDFVGTATPTASSSEPPVDPARVTIMQLQGAQHQSPLLGLSVETQGVVTAVDNNGGRGFYLQDMTGDGDIATSDAVFVFTGSVPTVAVGDEVLVAATVSEFIPGGASTRNLSTTQLSSPSVSIISSNNPLPAPVILGGSGRVVPTENIDDDAFASFDPDTDGIDFFESLEAMRVRVAQPLAIAPTNRFGEIFTAADAGTAATGISARQTLNISENDFNPEKIQVDLDTGILPDFTLPSVSVGAALSDVTGVVGYSFGNFEVLPTEAFTVVADSALVAEASRLVAGDDTLSIASYNVLNLDPNDSDGDADIANNRFATIASHIFSNLNSPDIVGLQEIQDNNGSEQNTETSASLTLSLLVEAISNAGGPNYEYIDTEGLVASSVGGQPGGNIRVAYLYNPERVSFAAPAIPLTDLQDQSTNPDNPFFGSRVSLAADFEFNGEVVTVINNHLSSKGGSAPISGVEQPFDARQEEVAVNGSLDERQRQSAAVRDFVASWLQTDPDAKVVVLGDMNEFEFVSPVSEILSTNLNNLVLDIPSDERYSFIFQGNSQQLDHILVSDALRDDAMLDIVHVNAEFAETDQRGSDHEPLVALLRIEDSTISENTADLNGDGTVDRRDYVAFLRTFRLREGQRQFNPLADYDNNGRINRSDLAQFLDQYWATTVLLGDVDRDGDIDRRDRRLIARAFWSRPLSHRYRPDADLDQNGRINRKDLRLFYKLSE